MQKRLPKGGRFYSVIVVANDNSFQRVEMPRALCQKSIQIRGSMHYILIHNADADVVLRDS